MQELIKKVSSYQDEIGEKSVTIFVDSKLFKLVGGWQWDMACDSIYCSDVMFSLPENFIGTKGIIHPDDVISIHKNIYFHEAIGEGDTSDLQFRIITTYGEVKVLTGKKIQFVDKEQDAFLKDPVESFIKKSFKEADLLKENEELSLKQSISEFSEVINKSGSWFFNLATSESYYSDNYYRIFGLPPQSLNAQLYTFANFFHPLSIKH